MTLMFTLSEIGSQYKVVKQSDLILFSFKGLSLGGVRTTAKVSNWRNFAVGWFKSSLFSRQRFGSE